MEGIYINSSRAQAESEALLRPLELSVQLLSTIRKEGLAIYQYRPSVNFEKSEVADIAKIKFSYAYKYHHITAGVYPLFTSTQFDNLEGIAKAIDEVVAKAQQYKRTQIQSLV